MKYTASSWLAKSLSFFFFPTDKAIVFFILTQTLQRKNSRHPNDQCWLQTYICNLLSVSDKVTLSRQKRLQTLVFWFYWSANLWVTQWVCVSDEALFIYFLQVAWKWQYTAFPQGNLTQGIFSFNMFFTIIVSSNDGFMQQSYCTDEEIYGHENRQCDRLVTRN